MLSQAHNSRCQDRVAGLFVCPRRNPSLLGRSSVTVLAIVRERFTTEDLCFMATVACYECGKDFKVPRCRRLKARFCSISCYGQSITTSIERECGICGKLFLVQPGLLRKNHGRYCSSACGYEAMRQRAAALPSSDKFGRTKRAADRAWQKAIREHDNYTCQRCGMYDLHNCAHHIAPRRFRPDLKYDLANGITLCGHCHSWTHTHVKESTKMGLLSHVPEHLGTLWRRNRVMDSENAPNDTGALSPPTRN